MGLILLLLFNPFDVKWLLVIALVLISTGTSGAYVLEDVLKDLVHDIEKPQDQDETKSRARAEIWSRIAYVFGAISSILWVATDAVGGFQPTWRNSITICVTTMGTTSIVFSRGKKYYRQGELKRRPAKIFFTVIGNRIKKLLKCNSWYLLI
ncbi:putative MFS transporter superfamily [Helianthus annuus]|nr:putative MFS transporter superfamily [Helianthus annuus]KAJ0529092.1 putative MFS transporter superfamily [Helianthus annuus]